MAVPYINIKLRYTVSFINRPVLSFHHTKCKLSTEAILIKNIPPDRESIGILELFCTSLIHDSSKVQG